MYLKGKKITESIKTSMLANPSEPSLDQAGIRAPLFTAGKWILVAVFLTLPMNSLRPTADVALADFLIALLLPVSFILFILQGKVGRFPKWLWVAAALILLSIGLIAILPPLDPERLLNALVIDGIGDGSSVVMGFRLIFALVAFPIAVGIAIDRWSTIKLLVDFWIVGVSISCAVALLDVVLGLGIQKAVTYDPETLNRYLVILDRQVGLTDHPNTLGLTAMLVSPLVLARMKTRQGVIRYGPVLALLAYAILVSGSRAAAVGLVLSIGLTIGMDGRFREKVKTLPRRTVLAIAACALVVVGLVGLGAYASPESDIGKLIPVSLSRALHPGAESSEYADSERGAWIENSVGFIKERPVLGYGYEWVEASHNIYLQLLLAGGLIALIAFGLAMAGYLKMVFRLRSIVPIDLRFTCIGLMISLVLYLVMGMVNNQIVDRHVYIPPALIMGMFLLAQARELSLSSTKED